MGERIQKIIRNSAAGMLAALFPALLQAQPEPLPLPQGTCEGVLPNGLHYILRQNDIPVSRIEFRLVLRTGSVQELDRETGCAHFLEHVAFGGSRHFPGKSLQSYLETLGMKYGVDINAFTSQDRTIYLFAVPTDSQHKGVIDSALLILRDWMDGLEICPERVETERGIILEELRGYDVGDPFYDLKIGEGIHARRLPLGTIEDIRRITPATLENYYRKWYVPELATIVAVGDFDTSELEGKIREQFSSLAPRKARDFKVYPLEYTPGTRVFEIRDSLYNRTQLEVMIPHRSITVRTLNDAVAKAREELFIEAVSTRMRGREIRTTISDTWYLSDKSHFTATTAGSSREELLDALAHLSSALHDLVTVGWDEAELADIRTRRCNRMAHFEVDAPQSSSAWCDDFADYILAGDRTIRDTLLYRRIIDSVAATPGALLQEMLRQRLAGYDSVARIACHSHPGLGAPLTAEEVDDAWHKGAATPCKRYVYEPRESSETEIPIETPNCLAVRPPFDQAMIVSTREYPGLGVREAVLQNGMRVIMRPTPGGGNVLFTLIAPYGTSAIPDDQYPLLEGTAGYLEMGGIAKADQQKLSEYLYQNDIALSMTLENHWHGFIGTTPAQTAPVFFNLIREKIFDPELRYDEFEELRQEMLQEKEEESLLSRMLQRASDRQLSARMDELTGSAIPRHATKLSNKVIAQRLNLDSIAAFYHRLYTPTEGSCAVITGEFDPDTLLTQFAATFAPILAQAYGPEFGYRQHHLPGQRSVEGFDNDNETQTLFDYIYPGYYEPSLRSSLKLKLMRDILRNRLISILRERESLVYSPYIALFYEGIPTRSFCFDINASADNRNMPAIDTLLRTIITDLQIREVPAQELENLKRSFQIAKRETLTDDAASNWRNVLVGIIRNGETLSDFEEYDRILETITPAELRESFSQLLDPEYYVLLYLSKEKLKDDTSDR